MRDVDGARIGHYYERVDDGVIRRVDRVFWRAGLLCAAGQARRPTDLPGRWPSPWVAPVEVFREITLREVPVSEIEGAPDG